MSAGPGTRANIDEFTKTTAPGWRRSAGRRGGKAIIILNPADPPMIMRDTIFCAIAEDADRAAITPSIHDVVAEVQGYVPGYRLLNEPQFDDPSLNSGGQAVVTTFIEVEGAGDYLPPYAGNLDIMTAAATKVGEEIAKETLAVAGGGAGMSTDIFMSDLWDIRITDTSLRDGSHHKRHQFTADEVHAIVAALDAAGVPVIEVTHGDGLGGSSFNYGFSKTPEQELIKLAAETANQAQDRVPDAARRRHQGRHQGGAGQRRVHLPDRHPLHRGRRVHPALRPRPRAGPGDRRLPDDGPHHPAREAGRAGPDHGRRRLPVRLRRRLRRRAGPRAGRPTGSPPWSPNSATTPRSASTATRTSASAWRTRSTPCAPAPSRSTARARRFGAGAGNTPVEAFIGVSDKLGIKTGIDFFDIADAAEDVVRPAMPAECLLDRNALIMGYAGVYSSFLKHAIRQAERYGVPAHRNAAPRRATQTHRRPGRPAHRHRAGNPARARERPSGRPLGSANTRRPSSHISHVSTAESVMVAVEK